MKPQVYAVTAQLGSQLYLRQHMHVMCAMFPTVITVNINLFELTREYDESHEMIMVIILHIWFLVSEITFTGTET